jgi:hypothetical protein
MSFVGHKYPISAARERARLTPLLVVAEDEESSVGLGELA